MSPHHMIIHDAIAQVILASSTQINYGGNTLNTLSNASKLQFDCAYFK